LRFAIVSNTNDSLVFRFHYSAALLVRSKWDQTLSSSSLEKTIAMRIKKDMEVEDEKPKQSNTVFFIHCGRRET